MMTIIDLSVMVNYLDFIIEVLYVSNFMCHINLIEYQRVKKYYFWSNLYVYKFTFHNK